MHELLVIVDSADPTTFAEVRSMLAFFQALRPVPFLVAANKQDQPGAKAPHELATAFGLLPALIVPCIVTETVRARAVLAQLLVGTPLVVPDAETQAAAALVPRPPAPLAIVTWPGARQHLTRGEGVTLCGRSIPPAALPVVIAAEGG